jgi:uncharacterized membrane protein YhaH (DUF805 family)
MNYFLLAFKKYAKFSGRSTRPEYWYFNLFSVLMQIFLSALIILTAQMSQELSLVVNIIYLLFSLSIFIPSIAVGFRRMHDIGESGWMLFINLIPLFGFIWYIVLLCTKSDEGANKYGPATK